VKLNDGWWITPSFCAMQCSVVKSECECGRVGVGVGVGEEDTAYSGIEAWSSGTCP
jgi:hypothetical protein